MSVIEGQAICRIDAEIDAAPVEKRDTRPRPVVQLLRSRERGQLGHARVGGSTRAGSSERGPVLVASQLAAADALAGELNLHALRVQPRVLVCMRALLDPWLAADEDGACHADEEPCPICLTTVHASTHQLPRVKCATCQNGFHACCIYRWLSRRDTPEGGLCPMCRAVL